MALTRYSVAGYFVAAFGVATRRGDRAAAVALDALVVDLVAVAVVVLGVRTAAGDPTAARVSAGLMALYLLTAVALLAADSLWPERLRVGGRPVRAEGMPWVEAACAAVALWSAVAVAVLLRASGSWSADSPARPGRAKSGSPL